jgi:hypothetical protein
MNYCSFLLEPIPIPNILNINICDTKWHQNVILFDSEGLEYIGIVDGKWFELEERIKAFLELKGKACRNVRVGSLSKADHNYETIESFFGNPPSSDYKFALLTLVVDADTYIKKSNKYFYCKNTFIKNTFIAKILLLKILLLQKYFY